MNISTIIIQLPKVLSDERLDLIILKLDEIRRIQKAKAVISLEKNEIITTAGYAVLMIILDAVAEHNHKIIL